MKQLFICEKCGKMFDDYSDASICEYSHREPDNFCEFVQPTYKEGGVMPQTLTVSFYTYSEAGERSFFYATYKFSKCFTPAENAEIEQQRFLQEEEANHRHEEWKARRDAERAAKVAAEAETTPEQETVSA